MSEPKVVLVSPVISRNGGYAFDTFAASDGLKRGFPYRRVEQANYDRKATLLGFHLPHGFIMLACETAHEFRRRCEELLGAIADAAPAGPDLPATAVLALEPKSFEI